MTKVSAPTADQVREARSRASLTQTKAAALVYLGSLQRWSEYELGKRDIDLARWELFLLKTGQHPKFNLREK